MGKRGPLKLMYIVIIIIAAVLVILGSVSFYILKYKIEKEPETLPEFWRGVGEKIVKTDEETTKEIIKDKKGQQIVGEEVVIDEDAVKAIVSKPRSSGGGGGGGGGGGASGGPVTVGGGSSAPPAQEPEAPAEEPEDPGEKVPEAIITDATICQNAQNANLCDGLDLAYGAGYSSLCCSEHTLCC